MEEILHQAEQLEKVYDWLGAAESYEKVLNLLSEDNSSRKGDITERLSYAFYRSAFQAENNDEFRKRMRQSIANYQKAKELHGKLNEHARTSRTIRCDAMIALTDYWLAPQAPEKKRLVNECWRFTKEALKVLDEIGSALEYGETYNRLSSTADETYCLEPSFQYREQLIREAMHYGERTITLLSNVNAPHELAKAYVKTAMYLSVFAWYFAIDIDEKDGYLRKGLDYWQKAKELSEETAFLALLSMPGEGLDWTYREILAQFGKALDYARKTKDKYLIGIALEWLKYATGWTIPSIEDPDKIREATEKVLQYAKDATHQFSLVSYVSPYPMFWSGAPYAVYYESLARWETDMEKKRDLLEKARIEFVAAVKQAESVGYPDVMMQTHGSLSMCLVSLARRETNSEEKKKLLESAEEHLKESLKIRRQLERFSYWNLGSSWIGLSHLKTELSKIETNDEKKKNMLEEAVAYQERGLQLCIKELSHRVKKDDVSMVGNLGKKQYVYGERLNLLHSLTHSDEIQKKALKAFKDSAELYQKVNLVSRVAESCWKIAESYDTLGEHLKAAENFSFASDNYRCATIRIPQLKDLYQDHTLYMQAWSEIEKARHNHDRQEYGLAREHFEKAADLHRSLKKWSYLAPNYSAWTRLEYAEDLSRKEQCEEAIQTFKEAIKLFDETKKSIQNELSKKEDADEKRIANSMVKATGTRREYCLARIAIEEAKILDKKGDHYSSSEKYSQAREAFEKMSQALETEQERKEFNLIISLTNAWQKMTSAEAKASSVLYLEASQIFEQAEDFSPNEKTKMLILGHSRFCKALEAGTRFADSRDAALHQIAEQHLESAASYYVRAGFPNASEYSKATEHLFDAYLYMDDAKREKDPEKKARLYTMAERILESAADSFMKAEHPEKREQVSRLLDMAKEEKELALSLSEVLHAPSIVSTTAAFNTPGPNHENAVGLERFEHADVYANVIVNRNELNVGENLDLEIELANAGKGTAFLDRIEGAIPNGFEIAEKLQTCRVEGCNVNMKGRRLEQLKGEDVKFSLRPKHKGSFTLRPVILYADENGNAKSHEPEPVIITVKELGIKGWLKGR